MAEAKRLDAEYEKHLDQVMDPLRDPKKDKSGYYRKGLAKYSNPCWSIIVGIIVQLISGAANAFYGLWIVEALFGMMIPDGQVPSRGDVLREYCLWIVLNACVTLVSTMIYKSCYIYVTENIILGIRSELYFSLLRKNLGWHDHKENGSGVMGTVLAKDVATLNGAGFEALGVMIEGFFAFAFALAIACYYEWRVALTTLAFAPLIMIAAVLQGKIEQ